MATVEETLRWSLPRRSAPSRWSVLGQGDAGGGWPFSLTRLNRSRDNASGAFRVHGGCLAAVLMYGWGTGGMGLNGAFSLGLSRDFIYICVCIYVCVCVYIF